MNIIIEIARIKYFNEFINDASKEIYTAYNKWINKPHNKNNVEYSFKYPINKLQIYANKNLRRVILFIVGLINSDKYVLFPNKEILIENKIMILNELFYISKGTNLPYDKINNILINNSNNYRDKIDTLYNAIDENVQYDIIKEIDGEYCNLKYKFEDYEVDNSHKSSTTYPRRYERNIKLKYTDYKSLKNKYVNNDNNKTKDVNKYIVQLMIRYNCFGDEKGMCLSANTLYDFIKDKKYDEISLEEFAGSLNSNLSNYCSLFYDIEHKFGSNGSFFMLSEEKLNKYKIFISNPPFISIVLKHNFEKNLKILERVDPVDIIICVPDRRSNEQYNKNEQSGHHISYGTTKQIDRYEDYEGYDSLYKYTKHVINMNDYKYYDYFIGHDSVIGGSTIFVCLSNYKSKLWKKFIKFLSSFNNFT